MNNNCYKQCRKNSLECFQHSDWKENNDSVKMYETRQGQKKTEMKQIKRNQVQMMTTIKLTIKTIFF